MKVTSVNVIVKNDFIEDFIVETKKNHDSTVKEKGNIRFDVLQNYSEPASFMLYEVFDSEEAAASHKKTEHYLTWKNNVSAWMEEPRKSDHYRVIAPSKENF